MNSEPDLQSAALKQLIQDVTTIVTQGGGENVVTVAVAERLTLALRGELGLPADYMRPQEHSYVMYPVWVAPSASFCVASAVWGVGQRTPIHDHGTWGVVGIYSGVEREERYGLDATVEQPVPRMLNERLLRCGDVVVCCTSDRDVHRVSSASDTPCVGLHIYGADIGSLPRRSYHPETGAVGWFVSGWANSAGE